ncbi:hypothetical protein C8R43DRAFT_379065 [Mycena crocata]|nr:hypothetical protein C8R43DRAFT_379065 [Mycena crocata]
MHQPPSFLRSWRRKGRPQTSSTQGSAPVVDVHLPPRSSNSSPVSARNSKRRPSDTPSESSARFLRIFKGNYTETDTSSLASVDEAAQKASMPSMHSPQSAPFAFPGPPSNDRISPLPSPHSLERPLPPVPPVRPPRPPSLNLDTIEFYPTPTNSKPAGSRRSPHRRPPVPENIPRRKLPQLDNVWEGFMKDAEGEDCDPFSVLPKVHSAALGTSLVGSCQRFEGVHTILESSLGRQPRPRPTFYRAGGSESTPYLASTSNLALESDSECSNDEITHGNNAGFSLSLFPSPPPLPMRRRATPKPLVLMPTPSIAPLPPSPSYSSRDSTPVATPTTPRSTEPSMYSARQSTSPVSILKKPGTSRSAVLTPPNTPTLTGESPRETQSASRIPLPRLRSAQSVPHLQASLLATTHRNTSSDTTSTNRRRVVSRPDVRGQQHLVRGHA